MQLGSGRHSYVLNSWMLLWLSNVYSQPYNMQLIVSNLLRMASFMLLILGILVVQTLLMLQISYTLVFVQIVHKKLNIFSMIFQQMISVFFSNNFHIWTQRLVEIKTWGLWPCVVCGEG
jgi:hypothetical protein